MATFLRLPQIDDVAIGDVNNDGRNDVVKLNGQSSINTSISVFLQSAGGILENSIPYSLGCNCLGKAIDIGDVNGDGRKDVVIARWISHSFVAVFPVYVQLQSFFDFPTPC